MLIDTGANITVDSGGVEAAAIAAEADGYDGFGVPETRHDSFVSLALAPRATSSITLQSGIAVAFARNNLITDDVLDAFAVSGTPADVAAAVQHRFGDIIDRISLYTPDPPDRAELRAATAALRAGAR